MRFFFSIVLTLGFLQPLFAQHTCGTVEYTRNYFTPVLPEPVFSRGNERDTVPNEIITIPVVIHLLYKSAEQNISDEQLLSQLDVLNRDFRRMNADAVNTPEAFRSVAADTRIMFCLAKVAPDGRPTSGIIRKFTGKDFFLLDDKMKYSAAGGDNAWDAKKYLNIWVCSLFGRNLGYATIPGGPADKDGVVINYDVFGNKGFVRPPFNKGRTATHEIGHWLGLKHLWGDMNCGDDDVTDTPRQLSYNFGCPTFPHVTGCSLTSNGDMFMNYMDFSDDACMNAFTYGQKMKMRALFALNGLKNSFLNSYVCDSSLSSGGPVPVDTMPVIKPVPGIRFFPNPVLSDLNIVPVNEYDLKGKECLVYSMEGQLLLKKTLSSNKEKLNLSNLAAGIYIIKIGSGAEKRIAKITKL